MTQFAGGYLSPFSRPSMGGGASTFQSAPVPPSRLRINGPQGTPTPNDGGMVTAPAPAPQAPAPPQPTTPATPSAPPPTFSEMQQQGRARPAPPPDYGATGYGAPPSGMQSGQLQQGIGSAAQQLLQQPSGYTSDAVQQSYNRLSQNIDDQYNQQNTLLKEDMARRGLSDSSIQGGRLADSNVAQRSAHNELATQLLMGQAQNQTADRTNALNAALGVQGQGYNQGLAGAQFGLQQNLGYGGFGLQQQQQGFAQQLASQQFAQQGQQFGQQLGLQQQALGQSGTNAQTQALLQLLGLSGSLNLTGAGQQTQLQQLMARLQGSGGGTANAPPPTYTPTYNQPPVY